MERALRAWQLRMQKCLRCGIEYQGNSCPVCDGSPVPSAGEIRKSLNKYSLLLAPGLLGGILAYIIYPPLDSGPLVVFGLCAFSLPLVLQLFSVARKRVSEDVSRLRTAYVYTSLALALLALMVLLNGSLDRTPRGAVRTTVTHKSSSRWRNTTSYRLTVSSWRAGRSVEELEVGARLYNNVFVGGVITVEAHKGFFGLPWYGDVSSK
jgi:hypothetical protein